MSFFHTRREGDEVLVSPVLFVVCDSDPRIQYAYREHKPAHTNATNCMPAQVVRYVPETDLAAVLRERDALREALAAAATVLDQAAANASDRTSAVSNDPVSVAVISDAADRARAVLATTPASTSLKHE